MEIGYITELVLRSLEENKYALETINTYKCVFSQITDFIREQGENEYVPQLGKDYLEFKRQSVNQKSFRLYQTVVSRLDDVFNGASFKKSHHAESELESPEVFAEVLQAFVSYQKEKGLHEMTVRYRAKNSAQFFTELAEHSCLSVGEITPELIFEILAGKGHLYRRSVRILLRFLHDSGHIPWNLTVFVGSKAMKHRLPDFYTKEEQLRILDAGSRSKRSPKRNKAIIMISTRYGFRDSDISALRFKNIDFVCNRISLEQDKTDVPVDFPLYDSVKEALLDYIDNERPVCDTDFIFVTSLAPHTKMETVYDIFDCAAKIAEIDSNGRGRGSKAFGRASLATAMINNGMSYEQARKALGHDCDNAIKAYAKQDVERLRICAIDVDLPTGSFAKILEGKETLWRK